jgi:lysophospholipase L1-like esterase
MCEANILSRWLSREVYNLGFNSSGKAEESVARVIAELRDIGAFVISTEGNCPSGEYLYENLGKFIEILREAHSRVPIILMQFAESGAERLISKKGEDRRAKREAQIRLVRERREQGDENIHLYLRDSEPELFDSHPVTPDRVVDGLHQTDYGYLETAKGLYKLLKNLL